MTTHRWHISTIRPSIDYWCTLGRRFRPWSYTWRPPSPLSVSPRRWTGPLCPGNQLLQSPGTHQQCKSMPRPVSTIQSYQVKYSKIIEFDCSGLNRLLSALQWTHGCLVYAVVSGFGRGRNTSLTWCMTLECTFWLFIFALRPSIHCYFTQRHALNELCAFN